MEWKKLIRLLYPPVWIIALLVTICTVALIYTFVGKYETHPVAYFTYVLSFYTLTVVVMRCIKTFPDIYKKIKGGVYKNPTGNRLMTDMKFRTHISLYTSFSINIIYVIFNIVSGFLFHTAWFFIFAFYYMVLAVMRFLLLRFVNRVGIGENRFKELRRSRLCGYILLSVNLALSGAVLMILYQNKGFFYNGIFIYVMAAFTFYIMTVAIINLIKYKKLGSPVMSMTKIISMAAALVSMLSLETAMLSEFGKDMSEENKRLMIMLTGAGVSVCIITMAVYSIIKNSSEIKKIMENKNYEE